MDSKFGDFIKRHEDLGKGAFQNNVLPNYRGIKFIIQDDEYRSELPDSGGSLAARVDAGRVQVATMFGRDAWTYLGVAGKNKTATNFKVQDITISGVELTISMRTAFNASVIQNKRGVNIAGTTEFYEDIDSLS